MIKDKVAIITGASSGIGYATAIALSKAGAKVAIGARRTDKLEQLENEIKQNGGEVFSQKLDVTKKSECDSFVKEVLSKWSSVDILVNNAGFFTPRDFFDELKIEEAEQMIEVNIKGVLYCTAAVISHMKEKKSGHIVNISSVSGRVVYPGGNVYLATKHVITAFSEGLRQEFSVRSNIRVTCIEPGKVYGSLPTHKRLFKKYVHKLKEKENMHPDDVANAVLFAVNAPNHVNVNEILVRSKSE